MNRRDVFEEATRRTLLEEQRVRPGSIQAVVRLLGSLDERIRFLEGVVEEAGRRGKL